jgi:hypothetical protein
LAEKALFSKVRENVTDTVEPTIEDESTVDDTKGVLVSQSGVMDTVKSSMF